MEKQSSPMVHETAIVENGAQIGFGTRIWHHSHIRSGAIIGADCVIGKNVYVDANVRIGERCKIQNNVSVYDGVQIKDDVFVGPSATFTNDLIPRAFNTDWKVTPTIVGRGSSIGANATVVCGNSLGDYCMVAAGATVVRDVEPHQLVVGTPARHLGWICVCGALVSREITRPDDIVCSSCMSESAK